MEPEQTGDDLLRSSSSERHAGVKRASAFAAAPRRGVDAVILWVRTLERLSSSLTVRIWRFRRACPGRRRVHRSSSPRSERSRRSSRRGDRRDPRAPRARASSGSNPHGARHSRERPAEPRARRSRRARARCRSSSSRAGSCRSGRCGLVHTSGTCSDAGPSVTLQESCEPHHRRLRSAAISCPISSSAPRPPTSGSERLFARASSPAARPTLATAGPTAGR